MKKSSFGAPKPLPGQAGYKASISDVLERENKEMEENLKLLKERLEQQEASDAKSSSGGGTRWKSARENSSIRAYAKDVQEKHKKKTLTKPDPSTRATAAARRTARETKATGDFSNKTVDSWSVSDVGDWLQSMMLSQYVPIFATNQISGPVLLDISLEDLDYMEIKALGHRKVILKGIEDLRQNKKVTKQLFAASDQGDTNSRSRSSEGRTEITADTAPSKIHWSHLEPLSANPVTGGEIPINGADAGNFDEEAERRAFQEAVMEWRRGGATTEKGIKTLSVRKSSENRDSDFTVEDDGMWNNPFAPNSATNNDILDEEAERQAFQAAVMEWRRGGSGAEKNSRESTSRLDSRSSAAGGGDEDEESYIISSARGERNLRSTGKSLADGTLDEEKEQAEFRAAVEAWRTGKPNPSSSVLTTAQRLAAELDREHQSTANRYTEYQQQMKQKIEQASRELEETKQRIQETAPLMDDLEDIEDSNYPFEGGDIDGHLSPCSSMGDHDDDHDPQMQSHVEISLLESHLNIGMNNEVKDIPMEYCVDEPPSDDENENDNEYNSESKYNQIDVIEIHTSK